jgi:hypothetical protein
MNNNDPNLLKEEMDDWQKRSHVERRAARDKRSADSSEYLSKGGKERRKKKSAGIPTSEETDGCVWESGAASLFLTNKHLLKI